jgi:hypothetical protein
MATSVARAASGSWLRVAARLVAVGAPFAGVSTAFADQIDAVSGFRIVSRLTGASSPNQTTRVGIGGTDLGHMVNHNGKTYFLYGDTFSGDTPSQGGNWRHNVMSYSTDTNPADGILFDGWQTTNGVAHEVIRSGIPGSITEIPTGGVSIGGRIYAWYMAVNWWGPAGQWTNNHAGLASWGEGESRFTVVPGFQFPSNSNFGMVAASLRAPSEAAGDNHLYVWGTPPGRYGGVKLARVLPGQVADKSAYEYYDGESAGRPVWTASEFDAVRIVDGPVGEMSVAYNEAARAWTMLSFSETRAAFELRQSEQPWGPWSAPLVVATSAQAPGGLYGPYLNPLYVEDGGRSIYFTMSLWNTYDVYLAKADLSITADPPFMVADANGDGRVDVTDLGILASNFNDGPPDPTGRTGGDFNRDGFVNVTDLGILATYFNQPDAAGGGPSFHEALAAYPHLPAGIPEPAALALTALIVPLLARPPSRR